MEIEIKTETELERPAARAPINPVSVAVLIVINLLPLYFVYGRGADISYLLSAYWLENIAIGVWTFARIVSAQGDPAGFVSSGSAAVNSINLRILIAVFFLIHYGMFTAVHGVFISTLFYVRISLASGAGITFLGFLASHGISYVNDYIRSGAYKTATPGQEMNRPYGRVVVMHAAILIGGVSGIAPIILIIGKTILDLYGHVRTVKTA